MKEEKSRKGKEIKKKKCGFNIDKGRKNKGVKEQIKEERKERVKRRAVT